MRHGTLALFVRAMRVDSRSLKLYMGLLAFLFGTMMALYSAHVDSIRLSAPGRSFFRWMLYIDMVAIFLMATQYFSISIVEEKEEMTLGLLKMAGISPVGLIAGKGIPRLLLVSILLILQFPFVTLAITMGGITAHQIFAGMIALLSFAFMGFGIGIYASVAARTAKGASSITMWLMLFVMLIGYLLFLVDSLFTYWGWTMPTMISSFREFMNSIAINHRFSVITATGFSGSYFSQQVYAHIFIGVIGSAAAWIIFERATKNEMPVAPPRLKSSMKRSSALRPGRPWSPNAMLVNPLAWKDFYFGSYGRAGLIGRVMLYPIIGVGFTALIYLVGGERLTVKMTGTVLLFVCLGGICVELIGIAGRFVNDEIKHNTWQSLFLLPTTVPGVVLSKLTGCLLAISPVFAWFFVGCVMGFENVVDFFDDVTRNDEGIIVFFCMFTAFCFVTVLTFALSITVKWGAGALAIGLTWLLMMCSVFCGQFLLRSPSEGYALVVAFTAWCVIALLLMYSMERLARLAQK